MIQELSSKADVLTKVVETLTATKTAEQSCQCAHTHPEPRPTAKKYGFPSCVEKGTDSCNHCFICGDAGHKAVGCLKRGKAKSPGQPSADVHALSSSNHPSIIKAEPQSGKRTQIQTSCVSPSLTSQPKPMKDWPS